MEFALICLSNLNFVEHTKLFFSHKYSFFHPILPPFKTSVSWTEHHFPWATTPMSVQVFKMSRRVDW
jgi:hypothetical protein